MKRARVFLGSNRVDWYWICDRCIDYKGPRAPEFGGCTSSLPTAHDQATAHMKLKHGGLE